MTVDDKVFDQLRDLGAIEADDKMNGIAAALGERATYSGLFAPPTADPLGESDLTSDTAPVAGREGQQSGGGDHVSETGDVSGLGGPPTDASPPPAEPAPETPPPPTPPAEEKPLAQMTRAELVDVAEREQVEHPADANKAAIVAAIIAKRKEAAA